MPKRVHILLLGQSGERLDVLEDMMVGESDINVSRKLLTPGLQSPLATLSFQPDVILLDIAENSQNMLQLVYEGMPVQSRPPMIVLGGIDDTDMMRRAMQAGARDFYGDDVSDEELVASVKRMGLESQLLLKESRGSLTTVINGKGGTGSSFIASCLATVPLVSERHNGRSVALLDLDFQFGDLPIYFDMKCDDSLLQALNTVNELDAVALEGFMRSHSTGVRVLAGRSEEIHDHMQFGPHEITTLLKLVTRVYDHVVVDLPRQFDTATIAALELADHVLVVTQQSVPHIRDTRFVVNLLRNIGLSNDSIKVLVNRFDKSSQVKMTDIQDVFGDFEIFSVPNDYRKAVSSVDNGTPLLQKWPKSPISQATVKMANSLWPQRNGVVTKRRRSSMFRRTPA